MHHVILHWFCVTFFAKNSTHIVPQPPYSPDLAPCDFWLYSKLQRPMRTIVLVQYISEQRKFEYGIRKDRRRRRVKKKKKLYKLVRKGRNTGTK
ncbi:unnamed protein product [Euphydryas editha]|uniref:Secreted protein n=1 Tax=Euphydryas editha TaxID=104508 RepID=A0AAU9TYG3_EUPED|nr:unnamed protein product [Euphydryas editha]